MTAELTLISRPADQSSYFSTHLATARIETHESGANDIPFIGWQIPLVASRAG